MFCDLLLQNPGYFDIVAHDVSVWHVPNNVELEQWKSAAILRYHTESHFLKEYGGNLFSLFKVRKFDFVIGHLHLWIWNS